MRALPLTVGVLAAALLLTGCSDDGEDGGSASGSPSAKSGAACALAGLDVTVGPANTAPAPGDTGNVPVTVVNRTDATCVLEGLPVVRLVADSGPVDVPADSAAPTDSRTELVAGAETSFTLTYVRGADDGGDSLAVTALEIGVPGAGDTGRHDWDFGTVALKDDKGTPDASITGFQILAE